MIKLIADVLRSREYANLTNEAAVDLLGDYWNSIKRLYPGAFSVLERTLSYVIRA